MRGRIQGKRLQRGGERLTADNVAARSPGPPPVLAEGRLRRSDRRLDEGDQGSDSCNRVQIVKSSY